MTIQSILFLILYIRQVRHIEGVNTYRSIILCPELTAATIGPPKLPRISTNDRISLLARSTPITIQPDYHIDERI